MAYRIIFHNFEFYDLSSKMYLKLNIFITLLFSTLNLFSQAIFTENKGQLPSQVAYAFKTDASQIYFEETGFLFNLLDINALYGGSVHHGHHSEIPLPKEIQAHAYRMIFENALTPEIIGLNPSKDYENYFLGNNPKQWASYVKKYQTIIYKQLYPNIDLKINNSKKGIKYDFIIHSSGNINDIAITYKGADKISLIEGQLIIETSVQKITEYAPIVYQKINGKIIKIPAEYILKENTIYFKLHRGYNKKYDLIIDPTLVFSTYSGATKDNWGFTAAGDLLGNVFGGGIIYNSGYPGSLGAYKQDHIGNSDVFISKYTPDGTQRIWATYLGGQYAEMPHSLIVDDRNNLVVLGTTGSDNFPVSDNAYDKTFNGGNDITYDNVVEFPQGVDIFITKLSENGTQLLASTFIGGNKNDGINWRNSYQSHIMDGNGALYYNYADGARGEIILDKDNNVYVGSNTFSSNFPIKNGWQNLLGGQQDGIVFKMNNDLSQLIWSSYLGSDKDDIINSITINENNEVYVGGGTQSQYFPTTHNAYKPYYLGGITDGFISHFSNDGKILLASTFYGSDQYDQVFFVRTDKSSNIYIAGQTKAKDSTLIYNAAYSHYNSGQFIAKFSNNLKAIEWSTVFGTGNGKPNISITAFNVDVCRRIYLSGWGREWGKWTTMEGTKGMEITPDAFQKTTDGQDFYIMVLYENATALDYATFLGEQHYGSGYCGHDHVDGGTSRFNKKGEIYQAVCASCGNVNLSGSSPSCDAFPTTSGAWSEHNGGIIDQNWVCNNVVFRFSFADDITLADFYTPDVCYPDSSFITHTGRGKYHLWDFGDGSSVDTSMDPSHLFSPGEHLISYVTIDSSTCNISDTIQKTIFVQNPQTLQLKEKLICRYDTIPIGINPEKDKSYSWFPNYNLTQTNIANPLAFPSTDTTYILQIHNKLCIDTLIETVKIDTAILLTTAHSKPYHIMIGESSQLIASGKNEYQYYWYPSYKLDNPNIRNPMVHPKKTTIYQVDIIDSLGCIHTDTTIVYVQDYICGEPNIFVPNAFSPNNDNNNDILYIHGKGIEDIYFAIYNRWGEKVFETTNINYGWDGVYKGEFVDPAVFVYYLRATCINEHIFEKKGNITVVR